MQPTDLDTAPEEDIARMIKDELNDVYGIDDEFMANQNLCLRTPEKRKFLNGEIRMAGCGAYHLMLYSKNYEDASKKLLFINIKGEEALYQDGYMSALLFIINSTIRNEIKELDADTYSWRNTRFIA